MIDIAAMKELLLRRHGTLKRRIDSAARELTTEHTRDWEDQAIERESDEVLATLSESDAREMEAIEAALKRIEEGTYGECVRCGEEISEDRLRVLPETPICRDCARARDDIFENVPV